MQRSGAAGACPQRRKEKGGPEAPDRPSCVVARKALALRELEAAASLGAAVLLALDDARVASQEAFALHRRAQRRFEAGQCRRDAVTDSARLARQAAALDGRFDVVLAAAVGDVEHLGDDQAQGRAREIDFLLAAVDHDLARTGLEPYSRDRVLAAASGISTPELVELLLAQHRLDLRALGRDALIGAGRNRFGRSFASGCRRRGL